MLCLKHGDDIASDRAASGSEGVLRMRWRSRVSTRSANTERTPAMEAGIADRLWTLAELLL
jgi:hypothetical protein